MDNADMPAMPIKGKDGQFLNFATEFDRGWFDQAGAMMTTGLTKREYFAAMAMQGVISNSTENSPAGDWLNCARHAAQAADALLAELERTK